jgi:membrane protease subunit HflC
MQRLIFLAVLGLAAVVFGSASLFMVDQREYAVVKQIGEIRRVIDQPGLYFKIPLIQLT